VYVAPPSGLLLLMREMCMMHYHLATVEVTAIPMREKDQVCALDHTVTLISSHARHNNLGKHYNGSTCSQDAHRSNYDVVLYYPMLPSMVQESSRKITPGTGELSRKRRLTLRWKSIDRKTNAGTAHSHSVRCPDILKKIFSGYQI
jgi:hypothetical protein